MRKSLSNWLIIESGALIVAGLGFLMSLLVERSLYQAILAGCCAFLVTNVGFAIKYFRSHR